MIWLAAKGIVGMKNKPLETSGPPGVSNQKPTVSQSNREEKLWATLSAHCQMVNTKSIKTTEIVPVVVFSILVRINTHTAAEFQLLLVDNLELLRRCDFLCFIAPVNEIANHFLLWHRCMNMYALERRDDEDSVDQNA